MNTEQIEELMDMFDSVIVHGINLSEQQKKQCVEVAKKYASQINKVSEPIKDEELAEKIIKHNIPNGIVNVHAKGKGNGKPQYQAEINTIKNCMEQYASSIQYNSAWKELSKIATPEKWIGMYAHYQDLLIQKDVSGFHKEQFDIANSERNELKEKQNISSGVWIKANAENISLLGMANLFIRYNENKDMEIGAAYVVKELMENGWDDVYYLDESKQNNVEDIDKWVDVKDGLPDYDVKVLVVGERIGINPQMGGAYIGIAKRQDLTKTSMAKDANRYQDENQFSQMSYVKKWQPLPKLPNQ